MLPVEPTQKLKDQYPHLRIVKFVSPEGVPDDECGDVVSLGGLVEGGPFDGGPIIRTFWKPSELELAALNSGAVIELDFYTDRMCMTAMNVEYPMEVSFSDE